MVVQLSLDIRSPKKKGPIEVPQELIRILEEYDFRKIGEFIIKCRKMGLKFDVEVDKVSNPREAVEACKGEEEMGPKVIYYTLMYVGLMNRICMGSVDKIFTMNFPVKVRSEKVGVSN